MIKSLSLCLAVIIYSSRAMRSSIDSESADFYRSMAARRRDYPSIERLNPYDGVYHTAAASRSNSESERKRAIDKFYDIGVDLYRKRRKHAGSSVDELDDLLNDVVDDDVSLCINVNDEGKDCYDGKPGFRRAANKFTSKKYDHLEYNIQSNTKKSANMYEVVATARYEDDNGDCERSMETNTFRFKGGKIVSSDISLAVSECAPRRGSRSGVVSVAAAAYSTSDRRERPSADSESERTQVMDKFYEIGLDLYRKRRRFSLEGLLTDCVTDDASLCLAVNGADKDCFKGKTGLRRAASIYAEQKFDHVEETKSITRKGDGLYEVVATALYEDDDGVCQVHIYVHCYSFLYFTLWH